MAVDQSGNADSSPCIYDFLRRPRGYNLGGLANGSKLSTTNSNTCIADDPPFTINGDQPIDIGDEAVGLHMIVHTGEGKIHGDAAELSRIRFESG